MKKETKSGNKVTKNAFSCALDFIALRDRSEEEVRRYLLKKRKEYSSNETDEAITKLKEYGYLNDEKFARAFAVSRFSSGRSSVVVRRELLKKGIKRELVSEIIKETKPNFEEEVKTATAVVVRKYRVSSSLSAKDKTRVASFLARRGYEWEVIRKVLSLLGGDFVSDEAHGGSDNL